MRLEIRRLHDEFHNTSIYVTHDQVEAMTMADRIVVMQDGRIEQIGSPLELYDSPDNLFVAQFIGSPAMNVVEGVLRRNGAGAFVEAVGGLRWPLSGHGGVDGQAVVYGVRPEHLSVAGPDAPVQAEVIVVEPTGAETELLLRAGDTDMVVVMHGRTTAQPDDTVMLGVAAEKTHVFDAAGGQRLDTITGTIQ
jgi:multiple sugar transport system ATP-binding protein